MNKKFDKLVKATEMNKAIFLGNFSGPKKRGNKVRSFFDFLNEVFICLVVTAIQHCLKAWVKGVYVKAVNFRYETVMSKLIRLPV